MQAFSFVTTVAPTDYYVPDEQCDWNVLFFEQGEQHFIIVTSAQHPLQFAQLAQAVKRAINFEWDRHPMSAGQHNFELEEGLREMGEYFEGELPAA